MPKVLIVDDEESNCKVISRILKKEGYETITAFNGREALEQFEKHNPDIVLLDIMMPEMDGYDACRQLKQKPQFIPVILITALDLPEHKIKGIQIGADDFINKPFNPEELKARIRNLLKTKSYYDKLNTSLNDLNLLVSYSEKTLNEFTPQTFSPTSSLSYLLTHLLRKESVPEYTGPQYILIGENKDGYSTGFLYWFDNYAIKTTAKPVLIKLISELAVGVSFSINLYEVQEREKWEKLFSKVFPQPLNILNFSTYVGEKMTIFGINYNKIVEREDAYLLKGLCLTSGFLSAISEQIQEIDNAFKYTVSSLARASEVHDNETGNHILRINEYSKFLSECMGMPKEFTETLYFSAQMHDVGKIYIPEDIIKKKGPLSIEEYKITKLHTVYGVKILGNHPKLEIAREVAHSHHELWTGTGYPLGLKGEDIPISARIVTICDIYDALRSKRHYKNPLDHPTATSIILEGDKRTRPEHFDPEILNHFKKNTKQFEEIYASIRDPNE